MSEHSIQGVQVKKLKWLKDDRGRLLEILRCNDEIFKGFGQVYVTVVLPDVVKAWHYHKKQDDSFVALAGKVRVGLSDVPTAMRLGSTVVGTVQLAEAAGTQVPASALTRADRQPAVWVVDPVTTTVSLRPIAVERYDLARVIVGSGLQPGDVVVIAGVQTLRPGQKVRLLGATS